MFVGKLFDCSGETWCALSDTLGREEIVRLKALGSGCGPYVNRTLSKELIFEPSKLGKRAAAPVYELIRCTPELAGSSQFLVISDGGRDLLLHSSVLLKGVFAYWNYWIPVLLAPHAMDWFFWNREHNRYGIAGRQWFHWQELKYPDTQSTLDWLLNYPTARLFATSVHRHALRGRLDADWPEATFVCNARTTRVGTVDLVEDLQVLAVRPREARSELTCAPMRTDVEIWLKERAFRKN